MSQLTRLLRVLGSEPLAVEPRFAAAFLDVIRRKLAGGRFTGPELHAELGVPMPDERQADPPPPRLAVIPVWGVIAQHPQSMGASTEQIGAALDRALASDQVDGILLDVDSPGGTVTGVPELAAKIFGARGQKPMLAIANGLAASAGYWIASAADELWVTPSGEVGSIGVFTVHEDWSKYLEQEGITITGIAAGKYKLEGAFWEPLSDEARAVLQARVDEAYGWFTRAVAQHRGATAADVRSGYGQGRVLGAADAKQANMVDRIGTFAQAVERLASRAQPKRRGRRADVARRQLALDASGLI